VLGFSTIFWNTVWANRQPPTTMGVLCDPAHPLFKNFPTDYHSDYPWWYLIQHSVGTLLLDEQTPNLKPLVRVVDDWFTARRLGLVLEARVGKGKLIVSAIDIKLGTQLHGLSGFRADRHVATRPATRSF